MGYSYDRDGRLCCDGCGTGRTTKKRPCPYKVTFSAFNMRQFLPYCPAPAVCDECWQRHGGARAYHGERCRAGAAAAQAKDDAERAQLETGDAMLVSADGHPDHVHALFRALDGSETELTVPRDRWVQGAWLSEYTDLLPTSS